jgi:GNAT superfamily N-acetyltransferase
MYRIRIVDGTDEEVAENIRDLHELTFGNTAPQIDPESGWWWIVYDGRELAGFCGLMPATGTAGYAYFNRVGVLAQHRGNGLQKRLMRAMEAKARKLGFVAIVSDTTSDNPASANNMIACGYRLYWPEVPWALSYSIYFRKELQ